MKKSENSKKKKKILLTYSLISFSVLFIFLLLVILFLNIIKSSDESYYYNNSSLQINNDVEIDEISNFSNKDISINNDNEEILQDNINKDNDRKIVLTNPVEQIQKVKKKSICIIIDDYGYQDTSAILLSLPFKISVSILPRLPFSKSGFEIFANSKNITPMLHIPMESINKLSNGEKLEIKTDDTTDIIRKKLDIFFNEIPARFANNHMGSKVSLSEESVKVILNYLYEKGIRFIDSHTINNSLFVSAGKSLGYPVFENNLFLDYNDNENLPEKEFNKGLAILRTKDYIIIIGHNTKPNTISFLQRLTNQYFLNNYDFVTVRELFEKY